MTTLLNKSPSFIDTPEIKEGLYDDQTFSGQHHLFDSQLFNDENLITLLEEYPRQRIVPILMDEIDEDAPWVYGDAGNSSGAEILSAIKNGYFWLGLADLHKHDKFRALAKKLLNNTSYKPGHGRLMLVISSPNTGISYHMDPDQSILFLLRGHKTVEVYPQDNWDIASVHDLEKIYAGLIGWHIPYKKEWKKYAQIFSLSPGEFVHIPQGSPHKVKNDKALNVSLVITYFSPENLEKKQLFSANLGLRELCPFFSFSRLTTQGVKAKAKITTYDMLSKLNVIKHKKISNKDTYFKTLKRQFFIDTNSSTGYTFYNQQKP